MRTVAALFVATDGRYFGLPDVDPWDVQRDARLYAGPHPVVAHPPCARWGRMAETAFGKKLGTRRGDDGGCFSSALASVRTWGGVLEHPAGSSAFLASGLLHPETDGEWGPAGDLQGFIAQVEQGHYGHRTRKATWLYAVAGRGELPILPWGPSMPDGYEPYQRNRPVGVWSTFSRLSARQRSATPPAFRDMLLDLARRARPSVQARKSG